VGGVILWRNNITGGVIMGGVIMGGVINGGVIVGGVILWKELNMGGILWEEYYGRNIMGGILWE
jgi:hypothetical protein